MAVGAGTVDQGVDRYRNRDECCEDNKADHIPSLVKYLGLLLGRLDYVQFLKYSVLRLGIFLIVFFALWQLMGWPIFVAALIG
ncbi:hypothetical protein [Arthrobacter sp. JCM 19049]|uniref:hypothetical protein n=1 Tax=Arthrobacter sp. JCM 19049 TaxID=1460643 RepID=UPI002436946F|nr:hypothetical protein [Arthrobacter sp. JCM 19049]